MWIRRSSFWAMLATVSCGAAAAQTTDPLPSWNKGDARAAHRRFRRGGHAQGWQGIRRARGAHRRFRQRRHALVRAAHVRADGVHARSRQGALEPQHPEWKDKQPYKAVLDRDLKALSAQGEKGIADQIAGTHTGMSSDEFNRIATDWIAKARHPQYNRPYTETIYQPMRELLDYLRANGFKTYIVSGGGVDFMRPWTEKVYGIPPEQVVGSMGKLEFSMVDGKPVLMRLPQDRPRRKGPRQARRHPEIIGRKPIAAFMNPTAICRCCSTSPGVRAPACGHRSPHRRGARSRLRPQIIDRAPRQGARRGGGARLGRCRHEGGNRKKVFPFP